MMTASVAFSAPVAVQARAERRGARAQSAFFGGRAAGPVKASKASFASRALVQCQAAATGQKVDRAVEETAINAIRFLSIDGVEKANSGHPGLPMGCAPMTYVLFNEYMKFNPKNPQWFNRDRFVLSAGHGSMLHYSMLYLTGYDSVGKSDLASFRQWGSKTPGHPENFVTNGIEVTTGPLGQGVSMAVGLAMAEKHLAARYNKPGMSLVDHYTYTIMGDGCNQEGVSNEACSLAGHLGLGKLIAFYDDNGITIDGHTDISFTEDVMKRYEALGWHVQHVADGNTDLDAIRKAIDLAKADPRPSLIKVTTIIGYGSPNKAGTHDVHGAALGAAENKATRENLKWTLEPFEVPENVLSLFREAIPRGAAYEKEWNASLDEYCKKYPAEGAEFKGLISGELPSGWADALPKYTPETPGDATRNTSHKTLNALAPVLPGFLGGSADLAPSNMTLMKMFGDFQKDTPAERNLRFGVREFGMGCIANGLALHASGLIPYCATFFIFTDYMRSAIRTAALSEVGTIFVMTHDSIGLGEDGPTHQPIEHLASFRAMPNINVMRPADGNETSGAYKVAVESRKRPTLLALSRQKLPNLPGTSVEGTAKGGYICQDCSGTPDAIIMATGSELEIAYKAAEQLTKDGMKIRVVSMVCTDLFDEQSKDYKESVLPTAVTKRVSIEAGTTFGWAKYTGTHGHNIGVDTFGASAPAPILYEKFGITADAIVKAIKGM